MGHVLRGERTRGGAFGSPRAALTAAVALGARRRGWRPVCVQARAPLAGVGSPPRLVKRAFPRPVPMVMTPQWLTSFMFGTSLRPCTTASLWIWMKTSCPPIRGRRSPSATARLKPSPSQLPGRFWPPFRIVPCSSIRPGQPMPMNGRASSSRCSARSISLTSMSAMRSIASSRSGLSSGCRQCWRFQTSASATLPRLSALSSTMPTRTFVPPMSTARMASCPARIQDGASCTPPIRPASSGWLLIGHSSTSTPSPVLRMIEARPMASSPMRLAIRPPPSTMRSVSFQLASRRKRRTTVASSAANSSTTVWTRAAAFGSSLTIILSSFALEMSSVGVSPSGSSPCSFSRSRQSARIARKARRLARSPTKPSSSRSSSL